MIARLAVLTASAPAVALATKDTSDIKFETYEVWGLPVASIVTSLMCVFLVRQVVGARQGKERGDAILTFLLMFIMFVYCVDMHPRAGPAAAYGIGLGGSGFIVVEVITKSFNKGLRTASERLTNAFFAFFNALATGKKDDDKDDDEPPAPDGPAPSPTPPEPVPAE